MRDERVPRKSMHRAAGAKRTRYSGIFWEDRELWEMWDNTLLSAISDVRVTTCVLCQTSQICLISQFPQFPQLSPFPLPRKFRGIRETNIGVGIVAHQVVGRTTRESAKY